MKKKLIAAGAASLAVAAMPIVGVFAESETTHSVKENITVEITPSCTIRNNNTQIPDTGVEPGLTNNYSVTMTNGQVNSNIVAGATGSADNTMYVHCNSSTRSWTLTAVGSGESGHESELYGSAGSIITGTGTSGATSNWAFKATLTGTGLNVDTNFTSGAWTEVPAAGTPKTLAIGSGTVGSEASPSITTNYQVYVSPTQAAGTYTGAVTYTLTSPNE